MSQKWLQGQRVQRIRWDDGRKEKENSFFCSDIMICIWQKLGNDTCPRTQEQRHLEVIGWSCILQLWQSASKGASLSTPPGPLCCVWHHQVENGNSMLKYICTRHEIEHQNLQRWIFQENVSLSSTVIHLHLIRYRAQSSMHKSFLVCSVCTGRGWD